MSILNIFDVMKWLNSSPNNCASFLKEAGDAQAGSYLRSSLKTFCTIIIVLQSSLSEHQLKKRNESSLLQNTLMQYMQYKNETK